LDREAVGKDAEELFAVQMNHSDLAKKMLERFYIGDMKKDEQKPVSYYARL